ncbi:hypothetical protein L249_8668 [Ophiocordyceps polyrhachis-furcata BCC 54312]|uniref:Uncharacterized protein n=1 Tax=Ophiocordyceps polyrhachis-furcata BCC 54312 TaxID=1330021 RepID=A0A367L6Y0_9HYPO|nr:hypothetical protein L249_8668 [Ophiocordyceps polyrhachis-furcata BCC 54312]
MPEAPGSRDTRSAGSNMGTTVAREMGAVPRTANGEAKKHQAMRGCYEGRTAFDRFNIEARWKHNVGFRLPSEGAPPEASKQHMLGPQSEVCVFPYLASLAFVGRGSEPLIFNSRIAAP